MSISDPDPPSTCAVITRLINPGGVPPYIYGDIGGPDRWIWFVLANLLALAAMCPFVGALSDLFGRRYVAMAGSLLIIVGMVVCSTAHVMNNFIGMSLIPFSREESCASTQLLGRHC